MFSRRKLRGLALSVVFILLGLARLAILLLISLAIALLVALTLLFRIAIALVGVVRV